MKQKLCRMRLNAIEATIAMVIQEKKKGVIFPSKFFLVEESPDGNETVILRVEKQNGCYLFRYGEWDTCTQGF